MNGGNSPDSLFYAQPIVVVLLLSFHHIQTLEDVDDVIHPSPFDFEKSCHILQIEDDIIAEFEVLDESLTQEL